MAFKGALEYVSRLQISGFCSVSSTHYLHLPDSDFFTLVLNVPFDISVECNANSDCSGKSPKTKCDENANTCGKFLSNQR